VAIAPTPDFAVSATYRKYHETQNTYT